jgi:hypothetical protein
MRERDSRRSKRAVSEGRQTRLWSRTGPGCPPPRPLAQPPSSWPSSLLVLVVASCSTDADRFMCEVEFRAARERSHISFIHLELTGPPAFRAAREPSRPSTLMSVLSRPSDPTRPDDGSFEISYYRFQSKVRFPPSRHLISLPLMLLPRHDPYRNMRPLGLWIYGPYSVHRQLPPDTRPVRRV